MTAQRFADDTFPPEIRSMPAEVAAGCPRRAEVGCAQQAAHGFGLVPAVLQPQHAARASDERGAPAMMRHAGRPARRPPSVKAPGAVRNAGRPAPGAGRCSRCKAGWRRSTSKCSARGQGRHTSRPARCSMGPQADAHFPPPPPARSALRSVAQHRGIRRAPGRLDIGDRTAARAQVQHRQRFETGQPLARAASTSSSVSGRGISTSGVDA